MEHNALAGGSPLRSEGLYPGDTALRAALDVLVDSFGVYACVREANGGIADFRPVHTRSGAREHGLEWGEIHPGSVVPPSLHPQAAGLLFDAYCDVVTTGQPMYRVEACRSDDGRGDDRAVRWYEVRATRHGDGVVVVWRDVTDRQRSTETFYRLIDGNPFGLYVVDADFRLARVSKGAQKVFESVRPLLGRDFAEVLRIVWAEPFASAAIDRFRHTLATGEPYLAPSTVERRNDLRVVEAYDWRIERIELPDGRYGVVCYFYDLSERQLYEAALQASEAKLRLALETSNTGLWEWNSGTGRLVWSPEACAIHGVTPADVDHAIESFVSFIHPEDRNGVLDALGTAMATETPYRAEIRIVRPSGEMRWVAVSGRAYRGGDGTPVLMLGTVQDITERVRFQARLMENEERLNFALLAAGAGVWERNAQDDLLAWSPESYALFERDPADGPPTTGEFYAQLHVDDAPRVRVAVLDAIAGRTPDYRVEYRLRRRDGSYRWLLSRGRVELDAQGRPIRLMGLNFDITERKAVEDALARTAERLQLAKRAGRLGIFDYDIVSGKIDWDDRMYELWGLDPSVSVDYGVFLGGVHPDDRKSTQAAVAAVLDSKVRGHYAAEYRVIDARTGIVRWLAAHGQVVFLDGAATRLVGTVQDTTERKVAEGRLRDSEAHFRAMANAAPAMLWISEPGGRCSFLSTRWYEYTGQAEGEGLGYGWLDAVHPDDREASRDMFARADARREPFSIDHRVRRADGIYRWVIDEGRPRFDAAGNFAGFVGSVIDMHARRTALEALHESEQRFRALADNISQFAWMADANGEIVWYNRRWYEYTGTTLDQMRGWGWTSVHHPDHIERIVEQWRRALASGEDWESTFPLRGADGQYRWFLTRASPIRDGEGRLSRWFGTNTDITDQRAAEAALLEADRRKDEFLAVLAHELRNPLAPLRNSLQLLKMQSDPAVGTRLRAIMERQVDTLVRLVDDLLDVSRITHGKLQLDAVRIDLCDAMRAALESCNGVIESAQHRLDLDIPALTVPVWGDHVRLAQVFSNLLNNAARYTPAPGVVRFSVRVERGTAIVEVADNGVGIAPEMLERVFDMFAQATGSTNHAQHGLGIGLSLSRSLVALHGGSICAQSDGVGRGSRFIVRLPVLAGDSSTTQRAASIPAGS